MDVKKSLSKLEEKILINKKYNSNDSILKSQILSANK